MARKYTTFTHKTPVYSEEQLRKWSKMEKEIKEFQKEHSKEVIKDYNVNGYVIRCIQRNYDKCMNKENEYGIQVWTKKPETVTFEELIEACTYNNWFDNANEANEAFKTVKAMILQG